MAITTYDQVTRLTMNFRGGRASAAQTAVGRATVRCGLRGWRARQQRAAELLVLSPAAEGLRAHDRRAQSFFEATRYLRDSGIGEIATRRLFGAGKN